MNSYFFLPLVLLKFWFLDAPLSLLGYFASLNYAFFELFSLPLFLRTFFKPLKNEYREGLVGFSRVLGMFVKSIFIVVDLLFLVVILTFETVVLLSFLAFPIATIFLLIYK